MAYEIQFYILLQSIIFHKLLKLFLLIPVKVIYLPVSTSFFLTSDCGTSATEENMKPDKWIQPENF